MANVTKKRIRDYVLDYYEIIVMGCVVILALAAFTVGYFTHAYLQIN